MGRPSDKDGVYTKILIDFSNKVENIESRLKFLPLRVVGASHSVSSIGTR